MNEMQLKYGRRGAFYCLGRVEGGDAGTCAAAGNDGRENGVGRG